MPLNFGRRAIWATSTTTRRFGSGGNGCTERSIGEGHLVDVIVIGATSIAALISVVSGVYAGIKMKHGTEHVAIVLGAISTSMAIATGYLMTL